MSETALSGILVVELGTRISAGVCSSLLRQLGATVVLIEQPAAGPTGSREALNRRQLSSGKLSFAPRADSAEDEQILRRLLACSDVVVTSSDIDSPFPLDVRALADSKQTVLCDITAFGSKGPLAKEGYSDLQVQAFSGIVDTTGMADGPPVPIGVPIVEYMTGTYAAGATLAALRVRRLSGVGQVIDMALYDCAFASLFTFMSGTLLAAKSSKSRVGNRHPTVVPWNLFNARDGWVLICAGNQGQWQRLCKLIGRPDLDDATTNTQEGRIARIVEIDAAIERWTKGLPASECIQKLSEAMIPSGPFVPIDDHPHEVNLDHRQMIQRLFDPVTQRDIFLPGSPLHMSVTPGLPPDRLPAADADRSEILQIVESRSQAEPAVVPLVPVAEPQRPLAGLRVIEIGQYTTAPLTARHLANLGAEVIKIEPPGGADGRAWKPVIKGQSVSFRANNADKRSLVLDLKTQSGIDMLARLIEKSDVLVENLKPGTLAKLGLSPQQMALSNPRLVYCAITGFGTNSLYANRPAFDMIIQSMSGFMDAVAPGGIPLKSGISTSDLMGAEMAVTAILAALEYRDRTNRGQYIDLSMQDITAWVAQAAWNRSADDGESETSVVRCEDGYVACEAPIADVALALQSPDSGVRSLDELAKVRRDDAVAILTAAKIRAAPVLAVNEAVLHRQTEVRRLWFTVNEDGDNWVLYASPLRLVRTPATVQRLGPLVDEDGPAILKQFGFAHAEAAAGGAA